ncbi:toxin-antitoxin system HicB family antitoxin [Mycolicibacterium cosmeticum]|uniref:HicB family protein n=1 Tax=Mycolicibacterium cosmeticum TaxID=258533 RepID=W9AUX8_MYCCO|nr:toxin-antitoxin system HicB family antitoxin [Mycolicibacterium cosmeticum]TLH74726.1 toxin-antitoxin system HicB family antitoxin [Mycolicibacterium cosmeticum]CDO09589.1 HicB family protein [Mycolicibacterium cosmeticum]
MPRYTYRAEWSPDAGKYNGRFVVRTSPVLHGKLMVEAAEQRVSLNQWVVQKLCGRPPSLDDLF